MRGPFANSPTLAQGRQGKERGNAAAVRICCAGERIRGCPHVCFTFRPEVDGVVLGPFLLVIGGFCDFCDGIVRRGWTVSFASDFEEMGRQAGS